MIGYYVHHHGSGHAARATAVAQRLSGPVVGLSSLARPPGWPGPWIQMPRDDTGIDPLDVDAHGRLHWVPEHDAGLRARSAEISEWIAAVDPDLMVVDVSVEVALLARLHGVPVIAVVQPGDRRDPAHQLVFSIARKLVAAWPEGQHGMVRGLDEHDSRLVCVGGISRHDGRAAAGPVGAVAPGAGDDRTEPRRVTVMMGRGGTDLTADVLDRAREQTPGWEWTVLDQDLGDWVDDTWPVLASSDVVVTHAGQNAISEVAAARRPAVVIPQTRPHGEQDAMAAALALGAQWPVLVAGTFPQRGWADLLDQAAALDGQRWSGWSDGLAADRAARAIEAELRAAAEVRA